jgi:anti-anti-sigma factor
MQAGEFMSLYIEMEQLGDVAVLQCAGRIVRTEALRVLKDAVTSLSQPRVIVLDLSEVKMLDGAGLGTLVFLHNWTCRNGIQLKLVNPSQLARKMIELTGLTSVLHVSSVNDVVEIFCGSHRTIENVDRAVA